MKGMGLSIYRASLCCLDTQSLSPPLAPPYGHTWRMPCQQHGKGPAMQGSKGPAVRTSTHCRTQRQGGKQAT